MTDRIERDDEGFGARLGATLRASEPLPTGAEARLLATLAATPRPSRPVPWWRRPRTIHLSPIGGLALAAGFAGLMVLGTLGASRGAAPAVAAAAPDTVHLVRFVLVNPGARQVALAGDFNGWQAEALTPTASGGVWSVALPLRAGRYEYAFVVDGERWLADPALPSTRDEFGGEHSVLHLGVDRVM
ncbi:MAG: glycogen-binding domain-containing protein [Gemmatimonadota bacterium]|jgi:hypothetical protein|nr:glycogen-binding domain-containing protein [Gemmatimonadota bacterium]MDQ8147858.1 glycogen-binding domain-containing protein [Gemmatimonadota bacterium]MDQ8149502.1 glycogen-binding domain-containing protein [Gemmatimonadota bacterium]MDQ8157290.1 glycogen-binding domain-containing protein [Gemmatimonadota bacterium]MDQ8177164.1 glycogen-binding domain-containing protein [Gemmatimonadota bacterium]